MDRKKRTHQHRQRPLALSRGAHWEQFPRDVRDRCRELVVQLLMSLARSQPAAGDDDER